MLTPVKPWTDSTLSVSQQKFMMSGKPVAMSALPLLHKIGTDPQFVSFDRHALSSLVRLPQNSDSFHGIEIAYLSCLDRNLVQEPKSKTISHP